MAYAKRSRDLQKIEDIILELCHQETPKLALLNFYITHVVAAGHSTRINAVISAPFFPSDALPLVRSAQQLNHGNTAQALLELDAPQSAFQYRKQCALNKRKIFHHNRDMAAVAQHGMAFIERECDEILIPFTLSIAAAAEASDNEELFAKAIQRLVSDGEKVMQSPALLRQHWSDAVAGSLALFNLDQAFLIATKIQQKYRDKSASHTLKKLAELQRDVTPYRSALHKAHRDVLSRAGLCQLIPQPDAQAIVIIPAASMRSNPIDYKGFRTNIRTILGEVIAFLESNMIPYSVKGRLQPHGNIDFPLPFISYHTVSSGNRGLHFKETDRPHSFSFDRQGYSGWSAFAQTPIAELNENVVDPQTAEFFFRKEQERIFASKISKYQQHDVVQKLPERYVFVALQMMGDAVQNLAFSSPTAMLDEIIATCLPLGITVVVKRHPLCSSPLIARYLAVREADGGVMISLDNIHTLIKNAIAVCTVNSGVGAEALLYEKPVYVFGRSDYMQACFICKEKGDFSRIFSYDRLPITRQQLYHFWWMLRNSYAFTMQNKKEFKAYLTEKLTLLLHHPSCKD